MKFTDLQIILKNRLGIEKLADIARELDVTPQVVNSWKTKNNVPYKSVVLLREKLNVIKEQHKHYPDQSQHDPEDNFNGHSQQAEWIDLAIKFYSLILKNRILFSSPIILILFTSIIYLTFFAKPVFISTASVAPTNTNQKQTSGFGNLAAQFGFNSLAGETNTLASSIMIPEILKSRRIAFELLPYKFMLKDSVESVTLATILNGEPIDVDTLNYKKRYRLTNKAKGLFIINKSKDSPIYFINAKSFNKKLSKQLADAIIERCNIIVRDIQSKDLELKQKYIDIRLSEISMELTKAEEKLKSFREKNISIISSPSLLLEQARLLRDLEVQTQLYIQLKSEFELLQIEDVGIKNTLQILDIAEVPTFKTSPKPTQFLIITFFIGIFISSVIVIAREWKIENNYNIEISKRNYLS
jgi:uncharacterized protein involved in exopolysaccharide biosynthesis